MFQMLPLHIMSRTAQKTMRCVTDNKLHPSRDVNIAGHSEVMLLIYLDRLLLSCSCGWR